MPTGRNDSDTNNKAMKPLPTSTAAEEEEEEVARDFRSMTMVVPSGDKHRLEELPTTPISVLPSLTANESRHAAVKRTLSNSRGTDEGNSSSTSTEITTTTANSGRGGHASKRLMSRCAAVLRSLQVEMGLKSCLRRTRAALETRRNIAQQCKGLRLSKGLDMLVVLLALKWKSTALRRPLRADTMAQNVRAKTRIYLKNRGPP